MLGGLKALRSYRRERDEEKGVWKDRPRHDWASHGADAFRYEAMAYQELKAEPPPRPKPKHVLEGNPDGTIRPTLTFNELVERQRAAA